MIRTGYGEMQLTEKLKFGFYLVFLVAFLGLLYL